MAVDVGQAHLSLALFSVSGLSLFFWSSVLSRLPLDPLTIDVDYLHPTVSVDLDTDGRVFSFSLVCWHLGFYQSRRLATTDGESDKFQIVSLHPPKS